MKTQHTKGVWNSYQWNNGVIAIQAPFSECGIPYGMFDLVTNIGPSSPRLVQEAKANAKLMAASPELLEALSAFVSRYDDLSERQLIKKLGNPEASKIIAGRNAILKATT